MKLTKKRQQILNLIQSSDTPINAKFLKSKVDFDLSTVYRALEFLEKIIIFFHSTLKMKNITLRKKMPIFLFVILASILKLCLNFQMKKQKKKKAN